MPLVLLTFMVVTAKGENSNGAYIDYYLEDGTMYGCVGLTDATVYGGIGGKIIGDSLRLGSSVVTSNDVVNWNNITNGISVTHSWIDNDGVTNSQIFSSGILTEWNTNGVALP